MVKDIADSFVVNPKAASKITFATSRKAVVQFPPEIQLLRTAFPLEEVI
jgi:hypothetical protein